MRPLRKTVRQFSCIFVVNSGEVDDPLGTRRDSGANTFSADPGRIVRYSPPETGADDRVLGNNRRSGSLSRARMESGPSNAARSHKVHFARSLALCATRIKRRKRRFAPVLAPKSSSRSGWAACLTRIESQLARQTNESWLQCLGNCL